MAAVLVMEGVCEACGAEIRVEVPPDAPRYVRRLAEDRIALGPLRECEACGTAADARRDDAVRADDRERARLERRRLAGMPVKWAGQMFGALDDATERLRAIAAAQQWAAGEVRGVVLWGGVGRGKTAIAAAAANERLTTGRAVRWVSVSELMMGLRSGFGTPQYEAALRVLEPGRSFPALVLDDLDKLKPSEHAVEPLYLAINSWVEAELPLLVTLNRPLSALSDWLPETFGDAIASRLQGYCKVWEVGGVDRRTT